MWSVEQGLNTDEKAQARSNIGVADAISGAINALDAEEVSTDGTNVQFQVTETDGKITGVSVTTDNTVNATDVSNAITTAINGLDSNATSNDGTNVQVKVTETDGKISAVNITSDNTVNATDVGNAITTAINGLDSDATSTDGTNVQVKVTETDGKISAVNITSDNTVNATDVSDAITTAINGLDSNATSNDGTNVQVKVTETDGKISAVNITSDNTVNATDVGNAITTAINDLDSNATSNDGTNVQVKVTETDGKISAVNITSDNTVNAMDVGNAITTAINDLDSDATSNDGTNVQVKVTETDGKITAVNITSDNTVNAMDVGNAITTAIGNLDVPAEGTGAITGFGANKTLETLTETDGKIAATFQNIALGNINHEGKIGTAANKVIVTGANGVLTTGATDGTYNASTNPIATQSTVTSAINGLTYSDSAVTNQFVTSVSEADGIISVTRAQPSIGDLAAVASDKKNYSIGTNSSDGKIEAQNLTVSSATDGGDSDDLTFVSSVTQASNGKIAVTTKKVPYSIQFIDTNYTYDEVTALIADGKYPVVRYQNGYDTLYLPMFTAPSNSGTDIEFRGFAKNTASSVYKIVCDYETGFGELTSTAFVSTEDASNFIDNVTFDAAVGDNLPGSITLKYHKYNADYTGIITLSGDQGSGMGIRTVTPTQSPYAYRIVNLRPVPAYPTTYKDRILTVNSDGDGLEWRAPVNADWNATSGPAQILNKPTIPDNVFLAEYGVATVEDISAAKSAGKEVFTLIPGTYYSTVAYLREVTRNGANANFASVTSDVASVKTATVNSSGNWSNSTLNLATTTDSSLVQKKNYGDDEPSRVATLLIDSDDPESYAQVKADNATKGYLVQGPYKTLLDSGINGGYGVGDTNTPVYITSDGEFDTCALSTAEFIQFNYSNTTTAQDDVYAAIAAAYTNGKLPVLTCSVAGGALYWFPTANGSAGYAFSRHTSDTCCTAEFDHYQHILSVAQKTIIDYTAGTNVAIDPSTHEISATDTTYTAGTGIEINSSNVISNTMHQDTYGLMISYNTLGNAGTTTHSIGPWRIQVTKAAMAAWDSVTGATSLHIAFAHKSYLDGSITHGRILVDTLTPWADGAFSTVYTVHNQWSFDGTYAQGGSNEGFGLQLISPGADPDGNARSCPKTMRGYHFTVNCGINGPDWLECDASLLYINNNTSLTSNAARLLLRFKYFYI